MGVYANGHLIYGFVHDNENTALFNALMGKLGQEDEDEEDEVGDDVDICFEELHEELQEKHHISLRQVGYSSIDIIAAYSQHASGKGFDDQEIKSEDLMKIGEYNANIVAFLSELGIDASPYIPGWHLMAYMD